ncbi:MAG: ABC transporter ATP-binding protein, partial [Betaproteobacteria bacterium]|nr:ABC transporter ATP-binding protein [Betaproteobacteria bacterium]
MLKGVSKRFGSHQAVNDISIDLPSGCFLTLLGPSGCGKTTTLRILAGLETADSGQVLIDGEDVTGVPTFRRNIGMVFQALALFPHMTVGENVAFGLAVRGVAKPHATEKVKRALSLVHMQDFTLRRPHQLSGGQQQRVALARTLVYEPRILLLDEPFAALDRKLREAMQVELRDLTRAIGITTIFVTHDQEEALVMSDLVVVMNSGAIEQCGTPLEVYERPNTRFVADFMGFGNILEGAVERVTD